MTRESYEKIFQKVRSAEKGEALLWLLGEILTCTTGLVYIVSIAVNLLTNEWKDVLLILLIPAVSFGFVSCFRTIFNAKRPYEVYGFEPLIPKDTKGKSFPSRHVFSIFVIGSTLFWFYPVPGLVICLLGIVLAVIRVIVGVHFPRDVVAGAVIGILCGCVTQLFL